MELLSYRPSGKYRNCWKCGHTEEPLTGWQPETAVLLSEGIAYVGTMDSGREPGWLLRTCRHCGFQWGEKTRDADDGS